MSVAAKIIEAADIRSVVGEYTTLTRRGSEWRGPCPIHGGHGPNLSVNTAKGVYHCHTCKAGGSVIDFVRRVENKDYRSAVEGLSQRFGIDVRLSEWSNDQHKIKDAVEFASSWWRSDLMESASTISYLESKGIDPEFALEHGVGYCNSDTESFLRHTADHGIGTGALIKAGILYVTGSRNYIPMSNRMVVTVFDESGRAIGFSGRNIGGSGPKWLNSPESPIFSRKNTLYGLNWAKAEPDDEVVLVEGFFDVLSMVAAGKRAVVASMGTSLAQGQASKLSYYWDSCTVFYDGDKSGAKASFMAADRLLSAGIRVKVAVASGGLDPGEAVKRPEDVFGVLNGATDVMGLKVKMLEDTRHFSTPEKKRVAFDKLSPTISATLDPITKEIYASLVAEKLGISQEAVLAASRSGKPMYYIPSGGDIVSLEESVISVASSSDSHLESLIIAGVLAEDFREERWSKLYRALMDSYGERESVESVGTALDGAWNEGYLVLRRRAIAREMDDVRTRMAFATPEEKMNLLSELIRLKSEL